nr:ABC transporter permease [Fictibacillus phosphorivorans]
MRIRALVKRIIRQFIRDKRTLAMMFIAPLLILTLVNLVFSNNDYEPKIAVVSDQTMIINKFETADKAFTGYNTSKTAIDDLKDEKLDAMIEVQSQSATITLEGSNPTANKASMLTIEKALKKLNTHASEQSSIKT